MINLPEFLRLMPVCPVMYFRDTELWLFAALKGEEFINGSFLAAPVFNDKRQFGVLLLARNRHPEGPYESFGSEQRYMLEILSSFIAAEIDSRLLYDELENSYFRTISSLTKALEAKDPYTKGHSERVMKTSLGIAEELNLSASSLRTIRYAAVLHDIGKVGIRDSIIEKEDKLSSEEYDSIKQHTEIGYEILDSKGGWGEIRELIRYHHEKMDGSGYYGKKLGDYPWEAMIISLSDIFDALTSHRPYREALSKKEALKVLEELIGTSFDKRIFISFLSYLRREESSEGETS